MKTLFAMFGPILLVGLILLGPSLLSFHGPAQQTELDKCIDLVYARADSAGRILPSSGDTLVVELNYEQCKVEFGKLKEDLLQESGGN